MAKSKKNKPLLRYIRKNKQRILITFIFMLVISPYLDGTLKSSKLIQSFLVLILFEAIFYFLTRPVKKKSDLLDSDKENGNSEER